MRSARPARPTFRREHGLATATTTPRLAVLIAALLAVLIAGCASGPRQGDAGAVPSRRAPAAVSGSDGVGSDVPGDLASRPDAEPRVEPVRPGGANKPYQVLGHDYVPLTGDVSFRERGLASWYGRKFHGRRTASGELYDMYAMTAAHPTLPIPSYARIRNPANGRTVLVRINDRGPFHADRIVDLSYAAALKLDLLRGVAPVELERLTFDDIRAGLWRSGSAPMLAMASTSASSPAPPSPAVELAGPTIPAEALTLVAAAPAEVVAEAAPQTASSRGGRGYWVQLGAFRERAGAEGFQRRVAGDIEALAPLLATFGEAALYRVQAGPYPNRDEAQSAAQRIREALGLVPMVVERR